MPEPTDDRRDRLRASYDELRRVASSFAATVEAFEAHLAEQEQALDEARSAAPLQRAEAEIVRLKAEIARLETQHAADMRRVEAAADESARDAARFETERDEATRARTAAEARLAAAEAGAPRSEPGTAVPAGRLTAQPAGPTAAKARAAQPAAKARATPDPVASAPSDPAPSAMDEAVAGAFRAWCAAGNAVVGKAGFFAEALRQVLPGASASAVYRDANSQAQPITFGSGGSSPVEYWLVAAEGRHWLFPQPLSPGQFRELAPCFDGTATPAALASVRPAEVKPSGDRFELGRRGHVA